MLRISRWALAWAFVGALAVPTMVSFDGKTRLTSLDISSSLRQIDIQSLSDDAQFGQIMFSGRGKSMARFEPKVTWLMSFPNSGTTYTMINTETVSGRSVATNYAMEVPKDHGPPIPVRHKGPWQRNTDLPLPSKRVLCKTHCAAYNDKGSVKDSVSSFASFVDGCRETTEKKDKTISTSVHNKLRAYYEVEGLVDSAIHLIRDPFDNIISRMHLGFRHPHNTVEGARANQTSEELAAFMTSREGVKTWCKKIDESFWKAHKVTKDMNISDETRSLLPYDPTPYLHIPCHGEFFRYTQWHNYAVESIKKHNLDVLRVYYEDYGDSYNRTVDQILDFLGQSWENEPCPFNHGKTYRYALFENSVQHDIKRLIKEIASKDTWALLRGYFTTSSHKISSSSR